MFRLQNTSSEPSQLSSAIAELNNAGIKTSSKTAVTVNPHGTGAGATGEVVFGELVSNGSNYVSLKSPDVVAANVVITLPATTGNIGESLTTDGTGITSWTNSSKVSLVADTATATKKFMVFSDSTALPDTASALTASADIVFTPSTGILEPKELHVTTKMGVGTTAPRNPLSVSSASDAIASYHRTSWADDDSFETHVSGTPGTEFLSTFWYDQSASSLTNLTKLSKAGDLELTGGLQVATTGRYVGRQSFGPLSDAGALGSVVAVQTSGDNAFTIANAVNQVWAVGIKDVGKAFKIGRYSMGGAGVEMADGGTAFTSSSDERLKDILRPITNVLETLDGIRCVYYRFKPSCNLDLDEDGNCVYQKDRLGFIAQDLEIDYPDLVHTGVDDLKSVSYTEFIPVLTAAVKELTLRNSALEARILALETP